MEQLFANMRELPKEIATKALAGALVKAAKPIHDTAQAMAPKATGKLANSIRTAKDKKPQLSGMDARVVVFIPWKGSAAAKYWRYQEFGTSFLAPNPFMRPAFDMNAQNALRIIVQDLAAAIPRLANSLRK